MYVRICFGLADSADLPAEDGPAVEDDLAGWRTEARAAHDLKVTGGQAQSAAGQVTVTYVIAACRSGGIVEPPNHKDLGTIQIVLYTEVSEVKYIGTLKY